MSHALFDVSLKRVVGRYTRSFVRFRFRRITDVGHAQIYIAAFIGGGHGLSVGQIDGTKRRASRACLNCVTVSIGLSVRRVRVQDVTGRSDIGLIEGYWNNFVPPEIPHV